VDRVAQTLDTLMDVSEAETGTMALRTEPVEVGPLLEEVVALYADIAEDKGVALTASAPAGLRATADRSRLRQVVANVVDNAIKYTPGGGHVELTASSGSGVAISVRDDGVGIPAEDQPRVFDRLYRGDRSRSARGLGLGLSLAILVILLLLGRL
jgi:signal transduction histidine kinase